MNETNILGSETPPFSPPTSDEKTMGILANILCLVAPIIAPLVIYLMKKDESSYVRAHAAAALNFQLTVLIGVFICVFLFFIFIGFILLWLLGIAHLVCIIIGTIKASEDKFFKYPGSITFVK